MYQDEKNIIILHTLSFKFVKAFDKIALLSANTILISTININLDHYFNHIMFGY